MLFFLRGLRKSDYTLPRRNLAEPVWSRHNILKGVYNEHYPIFAAMLRTRQGFPTDSDCLERKIQIRRLCRGQRGVFEELIAVVVRPLS